MNGQCYHFQQGSCRYGVACRFLHSAPPSDRQRRHSDRRSLGWPPAEEQGACSGTRNWSASEANISEVSEKTWSLRVMSYNVLADALAFEHAQDLYRDVHRSLLDFNNRIAKISMEVQQLMPDVLSLQEVDRPDDFVYNLSKLGYQYDYVERTGDKTDGCACFWNAAKLRCRDSKMINFADIGLRDNVAQILVLEDAESEGQRVVIANTHILFNPKRGDIKVAQIRIILEAVHDMRQQYGGTVPCMFMGDLNLTPDSALYSFIATGQLDCLSQDPRNMSGQQESRSSQQFSMRRRSYAPQASRNVRTAVHPEFVAPPPGLTRGGFDLRNLKPDCDPLGPSGRSVITGPALLVEENRALATPALLNSSGVAAATPALQYQGTPARAPQWAPPVLPPNSSSCQLPQHTPQRMLQNTQRFGSGRGRVGMDLEQLAIAHTREVYNPTTALEPILRHPLQLQSAYMEVTGVEPAFTSSHLRFHGTVDYIWYTPEAGNVTVVPRRVLDPPLDCANTGLPTANCPSDHVCIVCDFALMYKASPSA
ncbi:hypothetical protein ABBQ38_001952 [Trebouxia sp. C0009 RCD-2024]